MTFYEFIKQLLDNLILEEKIKPLIIVMPLGYLNSNDERKKYPKIKEFSKRIACIDKKIYSILKKKS